MENITRGPISTEGGTSKVDRLGIGPLVRELKLAGKGDKAIADELNESEKLTGVNKLSTMGVWRWCKKNNVERDKPLGTRDAINVYQEECDMLADVNDALECTQFEISEYKRRINDGSANDIRCMKDLSIALEKLLARKQALVTSIKMTQEKVYTYTAVSEILTTIIEMVKEHDMSLFAQISVKIKESPMLQEAFRRVKEREQ